MIFPNHPNEDLLQELLAALEQEIGLLVLRKEQMSALWQSLAAHDNVAMERSLGELERTGAAQAANDRRLALALSRQAQAVGCPPDQARLGRLIAYLDPQDRLAVDRKRKQIVALVRQLRGRHMETALLLSECSRINRLLLDCLGPARQSVTLYDTQGASQWRPATGLVDTER